jgi:hypothetical protein
METVFFSETLASTDKSTRLKNPEEHHRHPYRSENLISQNAIGLVNDIFNSIEENGLNLNKCYC